MSLIDKYGQQLDGLGTGNSSLSKICVVSPSDHPHADVDYTSAAVGITSSEVDFSGNCGNLSSTIGPFAYNHRLVSQATGSNTTVRIHNTNTGKIIRSTFPVTDDKDEAATSGECSIDGVAGTSALIKLSFLDPAGSKTGALLPTGNATDNLDGVEASCIDVANPCVFVRASDLGVTRLELPEEFFKNAAQLRRLEEIRCLGAEKMGLFKKGDKPLAAIPKIAMVSKPVRHHVLSGEEIREDEVDIVARVISNGQPHRAIPLTAALCAGVAAHVKGSIVESMLAENRLDPDILRIGHASGSICIGVEKNIDGTVKLANVFRTARPLMEGKVFY
jgi:2-methylaconitate cis-trans-isomerase PrpF